MRGKCKKNGASQFQFPIFPGPRFPLYNFISKSPVEKWGGGEKVFAGIRQTGYFLGWELWSGTKAGPRPSAECNSL